MRVKLPDWEMELASRGSGKPVVLLHGVGLDHTIWRGMRDLYEPQIHFVAPDLRGHGKTELGEADQSLEQMAEDVLILLDRLGVEKVVLGGHSMGGYVALAFAEKHADRLSGLVMITSNAGSDSLEKKAQRYLDAETITKNGSAILAKSLSPKLSNDKLINSSMYQLISSTNPQGLSNAQKAIAQRPERLPVLANLTCPLLIVAGADDKIIPFEAAQAMALANPRAKFVVLPGIGHMPMMETPITLGALLLTL